MQPEYGDNFLLAFDYKLPPISKPIKKILYIHSSRMNQSFLSLKRTTQLYPDAEFFILKRSGITFPNCGLKSIKEITFNGDKLPLNFHLTENGQVLKEANIDLVFFCANYNIKLNSLDASITINYNNILRFTEDIQLYDWTCIIDNQFCIYYPYQIEIDKINKISGMDITFVTSAETDKEAKSLLTELGLPFKKN